MKHFVQNEIPLCFEWRSITKAFHSKALIVVAAFTSATTTTAAATTTVVTPRGVKGTKKC